MAPSSSKQKTVPSKLSAAKSKAMQPAPAPAAALSHSSKDHFDEDAEMKKLEERMMKKGEAAPKMVATPQKAPRSAHELSPAPEGGSKSRVRCKPATPSKVATPVKSPDPKKSKTVAPDVVLEVPDDSQGPAAGDEVGSVPKDGSVVEPSTGTCEHGKQGEQISGSEDTPMEDAGECKPTLMSNGSNGSAELRRIDTTTTVPDIGLECHLFMQQLVGDHDVEARERLHIQISHWFEKMRSWYAEEGDIWVSRLDPVLKPHCESLVVLLNEKDAQMANLHLAQLDEKPKIDEVEKGYKTMLAKLPEIIKKNNEDPKSLDSRTFSLLQWKSGKMDSIKSAGKKLEAELSSLSLKIRACMDLLIDAVQKADNVDECMEVQTDQQVPEKNDDDVIMTELEALMAQCVVSNGPDVGDSFLREPTLVLGQGDTGANQQDAPMESMPQDAQTPPSQEPVVEPSQTVATPGADSAQLSPEEAALKHLQDMEDGPLKSSLLALVSQGGARPAPSSNTPSAPAAAETAMRRQDTTQLQAQHHAVDADAIPQPDGTFLYRGPKGRLETWAEREYRLAHNQKMCFNRSFRNAPDEVVRASANRKYNRDLLALLYEDWLSSGQCWAKSATYLNAIRSKEERKRGTFVMRDKTWLIEKYTEPVAKDIMQDKRAKQSARKTHDPIYVMDNPDLPGSEEHQLFRVFDSLSFEDEETNRFESGINTTGEFSEEQSKELMPVILAGAKESGLFGGGDESQNLQTPGVGNKGAGKGKPGASTTLKPQKPKKVAGMKKQVQSKISVISTKLTDLKVLRNKVDNSPLSAGMTTGYIAELDARDSELQASKLELETLYMVEKDDSEIESDPVTKDQFQKALDSVDQLLPSYNTTIRSVKMAIDPPKPKAKGKAKAAAKKE